MKVIKRVLLGGLFTVFLLFGLAFAFRYFLSTPTIFDRPLFLTGHVETIEVFYTNPACDCANFIESKHFKDNPNYETKEDDYIFIEPSRPDLKVPDSYYNKGHFTKRLRLTGQFYADKGIPTSYEQKTPMKSDHAKVFRYDKIEIVSK